MKPASAMRQEAFLMQWACRKPGDVIPPGAGGKGPPDAVGVQDDCRGFPPVAVRGGWRLYTGRIRGKFRTLRAIAVQRSESRRSFGADLLAPRTRARPPRSTGSSGRGGPRAAASHLRQVRARVRRRPARHAPVRPAGSAHEPAVGLLGLRASGRPGLHARCRSVRPACSHPPGSARDLPLVAPVRTSPRLAADAAHCIGWRASASSAESATFLLYCIYNS